MTSSVLPHDDVAEIRPEYTRALFDLDQTFERIFDDLRPEQSDVVVVQYKRCRDSIYDLFEATREIINNSYTDSVVKATSQAAIQRLRDLNAELTERVKSERKSKQDGEEKLKHLAEKLAEKLMQCQKEEDTVRRVLASTLEDLVTVEKANEKLQTTVLSQTKEIEKLRDRIRNFELKTQELKTAQSRNQELTAMVDKLTKQVTESEANMCILSKELAELKTSPLKDLANELTTSKALTRELTKLTNDMKQNRLQPPPPPPPPSPVHGYVTPVYYYYY